MLSQQKEIIWCTLPQDAQSYINETLNDAKKREQKLLFSFKDE